VCLWSLEGRGILDVNRFFVRLTGRTRESVLGKDPSKTHILPPGLTLDAARSQRKRGGIPFELIHASGETRHASAWMEKTTVDGHACMLMFAIDLTERVRLERALRERTEFVDKLLENSPTPIYVRDSKSRFVLVNHAWEETTGLARRTVIGHTWSEIAPELDMGEQEKVNRRVYGGRAVVFEDILDTPTGRRNFITAKFPLRGLSGKVEQLGGISIEVTDQRRAVEDLEASEARYRLLFERNPLPMAVYDRETLAFLAVNEAAIEDYGYSRDDFLRMTVADLRAEEDRPPFLAKLAGFTGSSYRSAARLYRKDGSFLDVESVTNKIDYEGRPAGLILALDVTERRKAETDLRRSYEELRALSARLETIREEESTRIAREVHDKVGQALTLLRLDVGSLRALAETGDFASADERFDEMTRVLDETLDIVQRIAAELRPGVLDELGLKAAIQWQLDDFSRRAGIRSRFDAALPSTSIEPVRATAAFRIFQELLTNVARHAEARNVRVSLTAKNGHLELEVSDDGRGIAPDKAQDPTSFGLRAARERAAQLGGELSIDRSRRKGAAIRLTIPL